jgi:predicted nucleic acid-binding protein
LIYVDTSVIVAALDPTDPRREKARKALELHDNKVVSELVIAELASMLARQRRVLVSIRDKLGVDDHMASIAIILYILKRFNLKYTSVRGFSTTLFGKIYNPMAYAIEPTEKLRLKTLDLLHLAYIKAIREQGLWIHALLTADTDFKDIEKDLQESLGVTIDLLTPLPFQSPPHLLMWEDPRSCYILLSTLLSIKRFIDSPSTQTNISHLGHLESQNSACTSMVIDFIDINLFWIVLLLDPQGCYNIPVASRDFHLPHRDMDIPMGSLVAVEPSGKGLPSMLKNPKPF